MAKIAVIGDRDSVLGFRALGLEVHTVEDSTEARRLLRKAAEEGCAAVFLTEALAAPLQEEIDRYKEALTPAIVLIPGKGGSLGLGRLRCTTSWSVPWAQTSLEGSVTMGKVIKVSGPLVVADGMADANMADVVRVGPKQLIGEILNMTGDRASIQVYEETSGLGPGAEVVTTGAPLSVELGPGLIESIYDGIQRPLEEIRSMAGAHIPVAFRPHRCRRIKSGASPLWPSPATPWWPETCWVPCRRRPRCSTRSWSPTAWTAPWSGWQRQENTPSGTSSPRCVWRTAP